MPNPFPDDRIPELQELIFQGQKIGAIKLFRECTGHDLRGSKQAVEALESRLRESAPERFSGPQRKGCAGAVLAMAAVAGAVWAWL